MTTALSGGDRVLDLLSLAALACVGITGLARTLALAARGVWVLPIDRRRSPAETLADLASLLILVSWTAGAIATALAPERHPAFASFRALEAPWPALRWLGLALAGAGVALYIRALLDLGASWRFTIDRERAGDLVTTGVFSRTRNPIYLALAWLALGVSLALGSGLLLLLACTALPYFQYVVRREERFLTARWGEAYARYCDRVPRWLCRPRPKAPQG